MFFYLAAAKFSTKLFDNLINFYIGISKVRFKGMLQSPGHYASKGMLE